MKRQLKKHFCNEVLAQVQKKNFLLQKHKIKFLQMKNKKAGKKLYSVIALMNAINAFVSFKDCGTGIM